MKKIPLYLILFLVGLFNGYILFVLVGYIYAFDLSMDIIVSTVALLKEYDLSYMGWFILQVLNATVLIAVATPIFILSGVILISRFKLDPILVGSMSSLGVIMILLYTAIIYDATVIEILIDSGIIFGLTFFISYQTAKKV